MTRQSLEDELKKLRAQQREVERLLKAGQWTLKERERKSRATMLVAYGLVILDELERGIRRREDLMRECDRVLQQNSHRAAVGLPPLGRESHQQM